MTTPTTPAQRHEAVLQYVTTNPGYKVFQIATILGYTAGQVEYSLMALETRGILFSMDDNNGVSVFEMVGLDECY